MLLSTPQCSCGLMRLRHPPRVRLWTKQRSCRHCSGRRHTAGTACKIAPVDKTAPLLKSIHPVEKMCLGQLPGLLMSSINIVALVDKTLLGQPTRLLLSTKPCLLWTNSLLFDTTCLLSTTGLTRLSKHHSSRHCFR